MADLSTRFRAADQIPVDDVLDAVAQRLRAPEAQPVVASLSEGRSRRDLVRKIVTIAAAFAIAAAAFMAAVRIFSHTEPVPVAPPHLVTPRTGWRPTAQRGPDGAVYVSDCNNARILRVDPSGPVTLFAGAGAGGFTNGFSGDGGPATLAHFGCPTGLAWDGAGRLFVVDHLNNRVRVIDTNGVVTTLAGDGGSDLGDGGQASEAGLDQPTTLAFDEAGNLYVADRDAARIRKIDLSGVITTFAGTGKPGFSGDGGPATQAQIDVPDGMIFDAAGNLYFSDAANNRVRMIDTAGVITTVAGTGEAGYAGDGGPAVRATLADPSGLALDGAGNLYVADYDNNVVRRIDTHGIITTVAGNGKDSGRLGYSGPALQGYLRAPFRITSGPQGVFYVEEDDPVVPRVLAFDPTTGTLSTVAKLPVV